jgi:hypothetical protein
MEFQFLCPQGHLLQGDDSQVGQQCKCPYCGTEFLVPPPSGETPADEQHAAQQGAWSSTPATAGSHAAVFDNAEEPAQYEGQAPQASAEEAGEEEGGFPGIRIGGPHAHPDEVPAFGLVAAEQAAMVHVVCPNGHVLETPREMLGQDAMCPYCQATFRLRFEDTEEYRREREAQRERHELKLGKAWMNWAIAIGVVVVMGVILLVAMAVAD